MDDEVADGGDQWGLLPHVLHALAEAVVVFDAHGRVRLVNSAATSLFRASEEMLRTRLAGSPGWGWLDASGARQHPKQDPVVRSMATRQPLTGVRMRLDNRVESVPVSVATHPFIDGDGFGCVLAVTSLADREAMPLDLGVRAMTDPLTGLPNRALLIDRLGQALAHSARSSGLVALLFIDLDRFKVVNDELGHDAGDRLLTAVANRLQAGVRPGDTVARLGGDEFVVVCDGVAGPAMLTGLAERLHRILQEPVEVSGPVGMADIHPRASIGIAAVEAPGSVSAIELLHQADIAMYSAKADGRNRIRWFDEELQHETSRRLHLESDLVAAERRRQFTLDYQPVVDLQTGAVIGAEALARWDHPQQGRLTPDEFIPLAEQVGLIVPIGTWVLKTAARQLARWVDGSPDRHMGIAVNISARQLQPDLPRQVERLCQEVRLAPSAITLEMTETLLIEPTRRVLDALEALRELGVGLALDDFGTGYSPLTHLHTMPIDIVKIDRTLIEGVTTDRRRRAIVQAVVEMNRALGLDTVAEGVDGQATLAFLRDIGCGMGQGYWLARPRPADAIQPGEVVEPVERGA